MTLAIEREREDDDDAPASWTRWARSRGTLAEHQAGVAPWTMHERRVVEKPAKAPRRGRGGAR